MKNITKIIIAVAAIGGAWMLLRKKPETAAPAPAGSDTTTTDKPSPTEGKMAAVVKDAPAPFGMTQEQYEKNAGIQTMAFNGNSAKGLNLKSIPKK